MERRERGAPAVVCLMTIGVILGAWCLTAKAGPELVTPRQAIAAVVAGYLPAEASIAIVDLETTVEPEAGLVAHPDAAARFATRSRFVLLAGGVRRGLAVAIVNARTVVPRAARLIARDEEIGGDAVDFTETDVPAVAMRALLRAPEVIGLSARRQIAAGEVLTTSIVRQPPVVKSGDEVAATVRIGVVAVTATGTASGSGQVGDMIRVAQPHGRRLLRARITGPGTVEIVE